MDSDDDCAVSGFEAEAVAAVVVVVTRPPTRRAAPWLHVLSEVAVAVAVSVASHN